MLLFSTILDIKDTMTTDAFIKLVLEWNKGNQYAENVIPSIEWHGERNIKYGDEGLSLEIREHKNERIVAVRYEKRTSDGVIWDTDYVMNLRQMKMSISLDRSFTADVLDVDANFSTPYFIKLLIKRGYLKDDQDLAVQYKPILINTDNVGILSDVINGKSSYRLPVVYVSKTYHDEDPIDVQLLSHRLKGVAHVLLQESNALNPTIQKECDGRNEYYGAVGVYFPTAGTSPKRFIYRSAEGFDGLLYEKVLKCVIHYCSAQRLETLFTWTGVNNALLKESLATQSKGRLAAEEARRNAEAEVTKILEDMDEEERRIRKQAIDEATAESNKLLEQFDEEQNDLRKRIEALTNENEALRYENHGLKTKITSKDEIPVLFMGEESDFYPGEVKDLILEALSDALKSIPKGRRADVVSDIIANNDYQKTSATKAEEIKRLLKTYDGMTSTLRQTLQDYGFTITEEGKHYKLTYYGDGRYQTAFSKTPSDVRTGKNCSQEMVNLVF